MPRTDWVKELGAEKIGANLPAKEASCGNIGVCEKLLQESRNSIFKVEADGMRGTGFVGPGGKLITDYHVITGASEITAIAQDGKRYKLGAVKIDDIHDLAALEFVDGRPDNAKPLKLSTARPSKDAYQAILSHRWGNDLEISQGLFSLRDKLNDEKLDTPADRRNRERIMDEAPESLAEELKKFYNRPLDVVRIGGNHGSSGAPVFNENGHVTSVMDLRLDSKGVSYGTPSKFVKSMLNEKDDKFVIKSGYETGVQSYIREVATESALGSAFDIAVPFFGVKALSNAAFMSNVTRGGAIAGAAFLLYRGVSDYKEYRTGANDRDNLANGMALTGDALMTAGFGASQFHCPRFAAITMAAGLALRLGAEAVPNHYVMKEIARADGSGRPATLDYVVNH